MRQNHAMSNHSNRSGSASDAYRDETDINLLEHKRKEMEKWNDMYNNYWNEYNPNPTEKEYHDKYMPERPSSNVDQSKHKKIKSTDITHMIKSLENL